MQITTVGLIIAERTISDNDKLLTILTKDYGVIKAFARGVKKIKNKNFSALSLLSYSDLCIYKGQNKYIINHATLKKSFFKLKNDIDILTLSQYFCEVIINLIGENQDSENPLKLLLNCLYFLTEQKKNKSLIKSVFELRILSMSGFMPDLTMCSNCGNFSDNTNLNFILQKGQLICNDCLKKSSKKIHSIALNCNVLAALRFITYTDFNKMFSFSLSLDNQSVVSFITEKYLLHCIDKKLNTLDFYNHKHVGIAKRK